MAAPSEFAPLPFLRTQRLFALKAGANPREAVHPERFHAHRHAANASAGDGPAVPDAQSWEEVPNDALVDGAWNGQQRQFVCLTTDSGGGKSYTLRRIDFEVNGKKPALAFTVMIGDLKRATDLTELLVERVVSAPGFPDPTGNRARVRREVVRKRDAAQLVLQFDGLDQADANSVEVLKNLAAPNSVWARCRFVVAGRPFAIDHHWERLFAARSDWHFVQIAEFDEEQQCALLGKLRDKRDRFDAIPREARTLFTVPRVLQYLKCLPEESLAGLQTVSDVYARATAFMLNRALGQEELSALEAERYLAILGALAFGMYAQVQTDEKTQRPVPNLDRIVPGRLTGFMRSVHQKLRGAFKAHEVNVNYTERDFVGDCRVLSRLNAVLSHGWLDVDELSQPKSALLWRNASLQEFFAAYWATRWASPEDHTTIRNWLVDPLNDRNRPFYWFWCYASEMPDERVLETESEPRATWVRAMAPLYDPSAVRSTEFIFRSWERMRDTEPQQTFLAEFQGMLSRTRGTFEQQQIAREMMCAENWVTLAQKGSTLDDDTGEFLMGSADDDPDADDDKPQRPVTFAQPFRVCRYAVCNLEYELFQPKHQNRRWYGDERHPLAKGSPDGDDRCPVVNVSFYDAAVFAAWCGCAVPTEEQWEYACRAGTTGNYGVGDRRTLTAEHAHFGQNRGTGHTVPVHEKVANRWGLYQMHGNVDEWCDSWHDSKRLFSLLRGGSWLGSAWYCRAAYRFRREPAVRDRRSGFRLFSPVLSIT